MGGAQQKAKWVGVLMTARRVPHHDMNVVRAKTSGSAAVSNRSSLTTSPPRLPPVLLCSPTPTPQASAFVLFPTIHAACEVVMALRAAGRLPSAVELCDYASLRCVHTTGSGTGWE